jgi:WhiB family redox-sensing transcriptional regulator
MPIDNLHRLLTKYAGADWMMENNPCKGLNPDIFFPTRGVDTTRAIAICNTCRNRLNCLEYAMDTHMEHGIWGGTSERGRRRLRRMRRQPPPDLIALPAPSTLPSWPTEDDTN